MLSSVKAKPGFVSQLTGLLFLLSLSPTQASEADWSLFEAVRKADAAVVQIALNNKANVNAVNGIGRTVLMYAAEEGQLEIARLLLDRGADVNRQDNQGRTALMQAGRKPLGGDARQERRLQLIHLLIDRGADIHARDKTGMTVLMSAASSGSFSYVQLLLDQGLDARAKDKQGRTAIHYTGWSVRDYAPIMIALLEREVDFRGKNKIGNTPLMEAVRGGYEPIVQALLERGANVNERGWNGRTALMGARQASTVQMLLDKGADVHIRDKDGATALMHLAESGDVEPVRLLLAKGADVHVRDKKGRTAVFYVSEWREEQVKEILAALISKSADLNAQDKNGQTSLIFSAIIPLPHHSVSKYPENRARMLALLACGADVHARDKEGATALLRLMGDVAYTDLAQAMLAKGADPNVRDKQGRTPLMMAALMMFDDGLVKLLRDHGAHLGLREALLIGDTTVALQRIAEGANVHQRVFVREYPSAYRMTTLMVAARKGLVEVVPALLSRGAKINAKDDLGMTALHYAVGGMTEGSVIFVSMPLETVEPSVRGKIVRTLITHGADVNARAKNAELPIEWATRWGLTEIVQEFLHHGADVKGEKGKRALALAKENGLSEIASLLRQAGARE